MPKSSTPALLEIQVRFFVPFLTNAFIQFSGIPHKPNPPNIITAPSSISCIAASAFATTLFIIHVYKIKLREFRILLSDCFLWQVNIDPSDFEGIAWGSCDRL